MLVDIIVKKIGTINCCNVSRMTRGNARGSFAAQLRNILRKILSQIKPKLEANSKERKPRLTGSMAYKFAPVEIPLPCMPGL